MSTAIRIYGLFPHRGGFLVKTVDYHGVEYRMAAANVRQAYAVAYADEWIDPADTHPVGIVAVYSSMTGRTLWCGCSGHHVVGGFPTHGAGVLHLREIVAGHQRHCPRGPSATGVDFSRIGGEFGGYLRQLTEGTDVPRRPVGFHRAPTDEKGSL